MKEALKYLPVVSHNTTIDDIPGFPIQIRSKTQIEEENKGRDVRRFTLKMEREAEFREQMRKYQQQFSPQAVSKRLNTDIPLDNTENGNSHAPFEIRSLSV